MTLKMEIYQPLFIHLPMIFNLTGDINRRMMEGIDGADVVMVFVTLKYMRKVNGDTGSRIDNCQREFEYSVDTKKKEKIVCVTLDRLMSNPGNWKGE